MRLTVLRGPHVRCTAGVLYRRRQFEVQSDHVLFGLVCPAYLWYGLSIELLSSEFVRMDRYTIELERKLLGFSVSSEVFKTDAVGTGASV